MSTTPTTKKESPKQKLIKQIESDIAWAEDYQKEARWVKQGKRNLKYIESDFNEMKDVESKYIIATAYNLLSVIIPTLYYSDPFIKVIPTKKYIRVKDKEGEFVTLDCEKSAQILQAVLKNVIKNIEVANEFRIMIQDTLTWGHAIMKVGYTQNTEEPEIDNDYIYENNEGVYAQRVDPLELLYDPASSSPDSSRFLIHVTYKTLEELEDNPNYDKAALKDLKDKGHQKEDKTKCSKPVSKDFRKYLKVYEYHDHVKGRIYTYVKEGKKKKILWDRKNKLRFSSHFVQLKFTGDPNKFESIPMLSTIEDQAIALNTTFTLTIRHIQMFAGTFMYEMGAVDDDELDRWQNSEQGDFIQVQSGALQQGRIKRESPLSMGSDYFTSIITFNQLIDRTLGIKDFQQPGNTKRKTATENVMESTDASVRKEFHLGFVKTALVKVLSKISSIIQQFYDKEDFVQLTGDFQEWVPWSKYAIQGNYAFDFDVSTLTNFHQANSQGLIQAINIMAQNPSLAQELQNTIDPKKVIDIIFTGYGVSPSQVSRDKPLLMKERDPYEENDMVSGEGDYNTPTTIPDPLPNDPHEIHKEVHTAKLEELITLQREQEATELQRHIQMHDYIIQLITSLSGTPQASPQPQNPQLNPSLASSPAASPTAPQTEEEMQGGFTYSEPMTE